MIGFIPLGKRVCKVGFVELRFVAEADGKVFSFFVIPLASATIIDESMPPLRKAPSGNRRRPCVVPPSVPEGTAGGPVLRGNLALFQSRIRNLIVCYRFIHGSVFPDVSDDLVMSGFQFSNPQQHGFRPGYVIQLKGIGSGDDPAAWKIPCLPMPSFRWRSRTIAVGIRQQGFHTHVVACDKQFYVPFDRKWRARRSR